MTKTSAEHRLSPEFRSANKLSRILAVLLRVGFWFTLLFAAALVGVMILSAMIWPIWPLPADSVVSFHSPQLKVASLSPWSKLGVAATFLMMFGPSIAALHFGQRTFTRFARGEVFTLATIADIRAASLWMVAVAFATSTSVDQLMFYTSVRLDTDDLLFNPERWFFSLKTLFFSFNSGPLLFGLCIYVGAYVMAEARRIADDNASFV